MVDRTVNAAGHKFNVVLMKMSRYTGHITDAEIYRNSVWK